MKSSYLSPFICLALLALPMLPIRGAENAPASLLVRVGDVTDNRTTGSFNSECKVELIFMGDAAADAGSVKQVKLAEAADSVGRDLIPKKTDDFFSRFHNQDHDGATLKATVVLRNPSRNAASIKIVRGEVELFNPTKENGGLLVIKDILKHPAEPVQDAVLSKYGVQVMYLTKDTYEAKKKELQARDKSDETDKLSGAFADLFKGMFGGGMLSDSKSTLQLYIKDPDKRIIDAKFVDAQGKALRSNQSFSTGNFRSFGFEEIPATDTQLEVKLATPESLKSIPFKVENIPLP